ncbi:MAG: hypothetical protein IJW37_09940 [Lachnospiraceae bacterium]|nr:hypothetical protein [Lachnospiraceae bacterium]
MEELQVQLRTFQTELTDVRVNAEIRVEIGEFLRFADYFFDGFFADFSVMERIEEAVKQAEGTRGKIAEVLQQLNRLKQENEKRRESCKEQLERLITASGM